VAYWMAPLPMTLKVTFAVWNFSNSHTSRNTVLIYLHMIRKAHVFEISTVFLTMKDFSRSHAVTYTVSLSKWDFFSYSSTAVDKIPTDIMRCMVPLLQLCFLFSCAEHLLSYCLPSSDPDFQVFLSCLFPLHVVWHWRESMKSSKWLFLETGPM